MAWSDHIDVVLVETSHPGNIGAAARAMKTMGLSNLVLVNPKFFPDEWATSRATPRAVDILEKARVVPTLTDALKDVQCAIGTSAQSRHLVWPMLGPRALGPHVYGGAQQGQRIALVFGREREGLHNDELQQCHFHVEIPTSPECRALNLAAAVQVLCYEVMMAAREGLVAEPPAHEPAPMAQFDGFMQHLYTVLGDIRFLNTEHPRLLKERLRRLFLRAAPDSIEINILRGALKAVQSEDRRQKTDDWV